MSERMKWSEAEAVVRAYRAEHGADSVDVVTLARALGTDVAEVRRLAGRKPRFADRSGVLSAMIALAVVAATLLATGTAVFTKNPLVASLLSPAQPVTVEIASPTLRLAPVHTEAYYQEPGGYRRIIRYRFRPDDTL